MCNCLKICLRIVFGKKNQRDAIVPIPPANTVKLCRRQRLKLVKQHKLQRLIQYQKLHYSSYKILFSLKLFVLFFCVYLYYFFVFFALLMGNH